MAGTVPRIRGESATVHASATARRLARTIARAAQNPRENIRFPVDHVGVAVAARRDQPDVFGNRGMGRTGPLTIDDFMEIVGVRDIRRVQTFTSSVARPACLYWLRRQRAAIRPRACRTVCVAAMLRLARSHGKRCTQSALRSRCFLQRCRSAAWHNTHVGCIANSRGCTTMRA